MNAKILVLAALLSMFAHSSFAADYYLSPTGKDGNNGSKEAPWKSAKRASKKLKAGDTLYLLPGLYREPLVFQRLKGKQQAPITIRPLKEGSVILDGTDPLPNNWSLVTPNSDAGKLIQPQQWQRLSGKLYSLKLEQPIYSLIYNDRLMSDARWPNARWDDPWRLDRYMVLRRANEKSVKGKLVDDLPTENTLAESQLWLDYDRSQLSHREEYLGDTGLSFENAVAVMSYAWGSWATQVTGHNAGENSFEYDTEFNGSGSIQKEAKGFLNNRIGWKRGKRKFKISGHAGLHYFLMGLPALDIEQEWWYEKSNQTLYFIAPDGEKPSAELVRGKRRDHQLTVLNSTYVNVEGLQFYGSTALLKHLENSTLADCKFSFSAAQKFSVGNYDIPVTTRIENASGKKNGNKTYGNTLRNCQFTYLDGNAFEGRSNGLVIDNVLIYRTQQTTLGLDSRSMSINRPSVVRRVTINDVGASVGIKGGGIDSVYELNNISRFGGLQYDGASLQMGGREKFIYRYNWSHDHPKRSYRFDIGSYPSYANGFGEMSYNVAWNTPGGFAIKGDDHLIHNNVQLGDSAFELFNMKRWASKNERTLVANNIVKGYNTGPYDWHKPVARKSTTSAELIKSEDYWMKETVVNAFADSNGVKAKFDDGTKRTGKQSPLLAKPINDYNGDPKLVLRDPDNLDFRPKQNSQLVDSGYVIKGKDVPWRDDNFTGQELIQGNGPDIGAYEANSDHYWIPGFQFAWASTPVPKNKTVTAKSDADLMWLGAYRANRHHVYWHTEKSKVSNATLKSDSYRGAFSGSDNVYRFDKALPTGQTVYWRVDAEIDGKRIKGETWQFTVQ